MESTIKYDHKAGNLIASGTNKIYDILKYTIGPGGRNVLLDKGFHVQLVTNEGFHIIKDIELEDPFENEGIQLIKHAAVKTHQHAGDGSTTAVLLAAEMIREGIKAINAGFNPVLLKKGMNKAAGAVINTIRESVIRADNDRQLEKIAERAAGSPEISKIILEAFKNTGQNAVITIEETMDNRTTLEITNGIKFDKGYISPYFANNKDRLTVNFTDAYILITDMLVSSFSDILPLIEKVRDEGKPLLIIAEDVTSDVLTNLIANSIRGVISVSAVRAPGYGMQTYELLEDIAVFTGGRYFSAAKGDRLSDITVADLGMAESTRVESESTMISKGKGDKTRIKERIQLLFDKADKEEDGFERIRVQRRIASLSENAVIIKVGAPSQAEAKELKKRYEDALSAVYAAVEEGLVYGAASAYIQAAVQLDADEDFEKMHADEKQGMEIIKKALEVPLYHIAENAGLNGNMVVDAVKRSGAGFGYDINEGRIVDLKENEIYDPVKVVLTAFINAVSTATSVIACEAAVIKKSPEISGDKVAGEGFEPTTPRV